MGIRLGNQEPRLGLERLHSVRAGSEAGGGLSKSGQLHEHLGELRRVTALLAVHAAPGGDGFLGALPVVRDGGARNASVAYQALGMKTPAEAYALAA